MTSGDAISADVQAARQAAATAARGEPVPENTSGTQAGQEGILHPEKGGGGTQSNANPAQVPNNGSVPAVEHILEDQKVIEGSHEGAPGAPIASQALGPHSDSENAHKAQADWRSEGSPAVAFEAQPEAQYEVEEPSEAPVNGGLYPEDARIPDPDMAADAVPPSEEKDAGFDRALHARQAALGQLDRNKDGLITGDDLVTAAHEYEKLKKQVKWYRSCASIALVLLIIIVGIWIGIAILAKRVTGGVKVVKGGFYVSRSNGKVVSTGRSLYDVPTPVATQLLTLTPAQLETLETVTFAVTGQPIEQHVKVAGLASRANFVELRSGSGDSLTITPGAQIYASASVAATPVTITSANSFAPVK